MERLSGRRSLSPACNPAADSDFEEGAVLVTSRRELSGAPARAPERLRHGLIGVGVAAQRKVDLEGGGHCVSFLEALLIDEWTAAVTRCQTRLLAASDLQFARGG